MKTSLAFIIVFLVIVLMLIAIAVYGSRKEKVRHQRDLIKKRKDDSASKEKHKELYIKLYFLLSQTENSVLSFNPSVETISLGDINRNALSKIQEIKNSQDLRDVYLFDERKEEFKPVIEELARVKPTKWHLDSIYAYNLVMAKGKFLVEDEENKEFLKVAKEWLKNPGKK